MHSKKKNILLLIPNLGFGGAQRVFHDHSIELAKKYNVYECVFNTDQDLIYPTNNTLINLDVPAGATFLSKAYNFVQRCIKLRRIKHQYKIDVCISHLEGADYVNLLSKGKEKVILCIHGSKLHDQNIGGVIGWMRKKLFMPILYNRPFKLVTVSQDINRELIDGFQIKPHRILTINNFFHHEVIQAKALETIEPEYSHIFENNQVLITSGRLAKQKNQSFLLEIMAELVKRKTCKLVIVGDGELREDLLKQADSLQLKVFTIWDNDDASRDYDVYFLGYQANPFKYINKSTLFIFTSAWEGFPMALSEAMICEVPVISADCPTGPREILSPTYSPPNRIDKAEYAQYGILMPIKTHLSNADPISVWTDTLVMVLNDEKLRSSYAQKAKERMKDFTKEKVISQWEKVID